MRVWAGVRIAAAGLAAGGLLPAGLEAHGAAQQPMGTVASRAARVTGGLEVQGDDIRLVSNTSVTAYAETAPIRLTRGGEVLVCATSEFHLLHSGPESSLVFALDRGAVELRSRTQPQDMVLTPDLKFAFATAGELDLRIRVTREGDTCVENAGAGAPVVEITDAFSSASYRLTPGQHVLFEHGSLHEVVDRETSPCGCPAVVVGPQQLVATGTPAEMAAAEHPFPAAVSAGLAPAAVPETNAAAGGEGMQVVSVLTAGSPPPEAVPVPVVATPVVATPVVVATAPPPAPPGPTDLVHAVGRFWRKLFHRKS